MTNVPLLITADTRKVIAGTVTYINVLSTCVNIVLAWVLRKPDVHNFIHECVYFAMVPLLFFYSIIYFLSQKS